MDVVVHRIVQELVGNINGIMASAQTAQLSGGKINRVASEIQVSTQRLMKDQANAIIDFTNDEFDRAVNQLL